MTEAVDIPRAEVVTQPERPQTQEVFKKDQAGIQALVLIGQKPNRENPQTLDVAQIRSAAGTDTSTELDKAIENSSKLKAREAWKDIRPEDRMRVWKEKTNAFLDSHKLNEADSEGKEFLKRVFKTNNLDEVNADKVFATFSGEGGGRIRFFANRIAETNNLEQISKNYELIEKLAGFYSGDAKKFALILTDAFANAKNNAEAFTQAAQENITGGNTGDTNWEELERDSNEWIRLQENEKNLRQRTQAPGRATTEINESEQAVEAQPRGDTNAHEESSAAETRPERAGSSPTNQPEQASTPLQEVTPLKNKVGEIIASLRTKPDSFSAKFLPMLDMVGKFEVGKNELEAYKFLVTRLDSIFRNLNNIPAENKMDTLAESVEMFYALKIMVEGSQSEQPDQSHIEAMNKFYEVISSEGVRMNDVVQAGEMYDDKLMIAIGEQEGISRGSVVAQVWAPVFTHGDKLLQKARVVLGEQQVAQGAVTSESQTVH